VASIGRVAFLGTGSFGVPLLRHLPDLVDELLVVTAPDRPAGRGLQNRRSPVADAADELGAPLLAPERIRDPASIAAIHAWRPDGLLLAAYGQLVPPALLELAGREPLNVHPSLLPRHRGAAPVAATILAGDPEAGVTLMVMTAGLDAGPIVAQWRMPLSGREETPELEARLARLAADRIPPLLSSWAAGELESQPQDPALATVVHQFTRQDGWIDWQRPAIEIDRRVRALQPWPGAWTTIDGRRLHVRRALPGEAVPDIRPGTLLAGDPVRVACGQGSLILDEVQPEGRPIMPADDWRRGLPRQHVRLGSEDHSGGAGQE
jgi:methionyl-tRNA formyltransferase